MNRRTALLALVLVPLLGAGPNPLGRQRWEYASLMRGPDGVAVEMPGAEFLEPDANKALVRLGGAAEARGQPSTYRFLKALGSQGWELVDVEEEGSFRVYYFKRPTATPGAG